MKNKISALLLALLLCFSLISCSSSYNSPEQIDQSTASLEGQAGSQGTGTEGLVIPDASGNPEGKNANGTDVLTNGLPDAGSVLPSEEDIATQIPSNADAVFCIDDIPTYSGNAYVSVNKNIPYFDTTTLSAQSIESYSPLDELGRCGVAYACIGKDIMPTEERGSIGMVKPSGWHTVRYDDLIADKYLYNRCHLIGYQLTGENANLSNLITGTRYLGIEGMLPFENMTASYVENTGNHVAYRVTPVFEGNNMVATGILMEAYSVEDQGDGICFCIFAYNVQPGIEIDYATGDSHVAEEPSTPIAPVVVPTQPESPPVENTPSDPPDEEESVTADYILNTNTKKFHYPSCSSVSEMKDKNKKEFTGSRDDVIGMGYKPCGRCHP